MLSYVISNHDVARTILLRIERCAQQFVKVAEFSGITAKSLVFLTAILIGVFTASRQAVCAAGTITISPKSTSVSVGATEQFTVQVEGAVTWSVNDIGGGNATVGKISPTGLYTAPASVPDPKTVTVTVTSANGEKDTATVTIMPQVEVSPAAPTLSVGTTQQFVAQLSGTDNTAVTWSVNAIVEGNATVGTISTAGIYTAPASVPNPNPVIVTATSAADPSASSSAKVTITATPPSDTAPVDCNLGTDNGGANPNVTCFFIPYSYSMTRASFGKGVADRLLVAEVVVLNKNRDLEYLLQNITLGTSDIMTASLDKTLARRISEKTEQFSARAISVRLVEAGATALTGIAGVVDNELLKDAANLVAGPVQTGYRNAIPDLSTAELKTIDDSGFSVTSTVIPKNSALAMVAFMSSEVFTFDGKPFKKLEGDDLRGFERTMKVQVSGTHIQQVNLQLDHLALDGMAPSVKSGSTQEITIALKAQDGSTDTNFTGSIQFNNTDAKAELLPANYTFTDADKGSHKFSVEFKTTGLQTVTVTSNGLTPIKGSTTVN